MNVLITLTIVGTDAGPFNIPSSVTALSNLTLNNTNAIPATFGNRYYDPVVVMNLRPSHGSVRGTTMITVVGSHFESGELRCAFGDSVKAAVYLTSSAALCSSPAASTGTEMESPQLGSRTLHGGAFVCRHVGRRRSFE